jgi:hypothetical protein
LGQAQGGYLPFFLDDFFAFFATVVRLLLRRKVDGYSRAVDYPFDTIYRFPFFSGH